jgi:D-arabinose 1-dehydrogenase-like Zn-dependent alcohol dehydrogenase
MNAVRFHGKEDLRFEQVPEPECGKGQIKIKPAWCGICGRVCIGRQPGTQKERRRDIKTNTDTA